jgi:hypothetical protein
MDGFPVRFGRDQTTAAPGVNDLWLPQYGGEVLVAFDENLVAKQMVRMQTISQGNSLEFPMLHKMAASRHAAGEYITGQEVASGKRTISLDDRPLIAPWELDDIDLLKTHFEVRAEMSKQAGNALAREMDKNALQLVANAARTAADAGASVFNGGGYNSDPDAALTGADYTASSSAFATDTAGTLPDSATSRWGRNHALTLLKSLEDIAVSWDDRDIPQEDRSVAVMPAAWHCLRNIGLPESKTTTQTIVGYNPFRGGPGGDGVISPKDADPSRGSFLEFNSFKIFRTPNMPRQNITVGETKYRGDFTKVRALVCQKQAVGMLTLMGVQVEAARDIRTQTFLGVTKMLYGGGALRPECAVVVAIS